MVPQIRRRTRGGRGHATLVFRLHLQLMPSLLFPSLPLASLACRSSLCDSVCVPMFSSSSSSLPCQTGQRPLLDTSRSSFCIAREKELSRRTEDGKRNRRFSDIGEEINKEKTWSVWARTATARGPPLPPSSCRRRVNPKALHSLPPLRSACWIDTRSGVGSLT